MKYKIILLVLIGSIAVFASEDNTNNNNRYIEDVPINETENSIEINDSEESNGNQIQGNEVREIEQEQVEAGNNTIVPLYTENEVQAIHSIGIFYTHFLQEIFDAIRNVEIQEIFPVYIIPLLMNTPLNQLLFFQYWVYELVRTIESLVTIRFIQNENFTIYFRNQNPLDVFFTFILSTYFLLFQAFIHDPSIFEELDIIMPFVIILSSFVMTLHVSPHYILL
jgi:hypothetical protein